MMIFQFIMENVWLILIHNSELLALPADYVFAAMAWLSACVP